MWPPKRSPRPNTAFSASESILDQKRRNEQNIQQPGLIVEKQNTYFITIQSSSKSPGRKQSTVRKALFPTRPILFDARPIDDIEARPNDETEDLLSSERLRLMKLPLSRGVACPERSHSPSILSVSPEVSPAVYPELVCM